MARFPSQAGVRCASARSSPQKPSAPTNTTCTAASRGFSEAPPRVVPANAGTQPPAQVVEEGFGWLCSKNETTRRDGVDGPLRHRCARMRLLRSQTREPSVNQIIRIGMDTSKHIFQLHGVDAAERPVLRKRLRRREVVGFFAKLPPTVIGIEACGAAHYWARELTQLGHEVKLMAPQHVKPYVTRNKNDGRDSDALCEAMSRPRMRFVP